MSKPTGRPKGRTRTDSLKICAAAYLFAAHTKDVDEIATVFGMTHRNLFHWAKQPEWKQTLDHIGYNGDRSFLTKKKAARIAQAKSEWFDAVNAGMPEHKIAGHVAQKMGINGQTVREYARKFGWRADLT